MIDRIIGSKGIYITDASVYNVTLPRPEATVVLNYQRMSVNHGLNSWVGFSAAKHNEAIATGQFLLLDDEVAAVITTALRSDLEITGLADSSFFEGPKIRTMNFTGVGTYEGLAMAFREVLETIEHTRWEEILHKTVSLPPTLPLESSITAGHLNSTLDLKGALQTVCTA